MMTKTFFLPLAALGFAWGFVDDMVGLVYRRVR